MISLYPFQEKAVAFHVERRYSLNCSELGTGKSRMALATADAVGAKSIAVFGPAFLAATWKYEAETVGMKVRYYPYSMLHKTTAADLAGVDFFIADEVHACKNPMARRTNDFHTLLQTCRPDYFVGLTGTPIKNRANDFWTLLAFCSLGPAGNGEKLTMGYHEFSSHFCHVDIIRINGRSVRRYGSLRADRVGELKALLRGKYTRIRLADVVADLPAMTHKLVPVDCGGVSELSAAYREYLSGGEITSAKAASAALKAWATAEYAQDLLDQGVGSLLIYSDHVEPARRIAEALGGKWITGATPAAERGEIAAAFQIGHVKVIAATIGAFSTGVTLTRANNVIFNDMSWTPADNAQAEARIRRIGQALPCFTHVICGSEVDEMLFRTNKSKAGDVCAIM